MDGSFGLGNVMERLIGGGVTNLLLLPVLFQRMPGKLLVLAHVPGIDYSCTEAILLNELNDGLGSRLEF
jgi:hypothetical protein